MILMPFLVGLSLAFPQATQKVEVFRFSDRVVIKNAKTEKETVMFYNNKTTLLDQGDEVRQGSGAISECRFEDGGMVRFFSRARYRFGELTQKHHSIFVDDFTRILVKASEEIVFFLPGGTRLVTSFGECYIQREERRIQIRNPGFFEVELSGHLVAEENQVVPAGKSITIPLFDPDLTEEKEPIVVREISGIIVKTTGGYRFEEKPGCIVVSRPGSEDGLACVGGARVYMNPGESITLRIP